MVKAGRKGTLEVENHKVTKKDSRNFLNGKTLLSFQMVLLLKLCTQTEYYHSLPPSYFDGINRTKREIITGAAIFFVLDKLCVSFLIALRLPLYLLSVSTLLFLYFVFSHNRYVFKRRPNANVFLKIENVVWEMHRLLKGMEQTISLFGYDTMAKFPKKWDFNN